MVCPLRRLHEILVKGGTFDALYRLILAAPGRAWCWHAPTCCPRPP